MKRLNGKVAIITGGATGIGRSTAELFASEGAFVVVADIDEAHAIETVRTIDAAGGEAWSRSVDVTEPDGMRDLVAETIRRCGRLDIMHNNAGGSSARDGSAVEVELDEFWRAIKLNLFGTFLGCRFAIPEMIRTGGGSVINMISDLALMGVPGFDGYTSAKGGVMALTRSLAVTYGPKNVRVNAIAPGATRTPRVEKILRENCATKATADTQLFGMIDPSQIAHAALHLASDEARMMTGSVMVVDGGVTVM